MIEKGLDGIRSVMDACRTATSWGCAIAWWPMWRRCEASGPDLKIELLCDGAPEMWNLLEQGFTPKFGDDLHRLVDLCHLTEKLGAAAHAMDSDSKVADEKLTRWKMTLLNRASAAIDILVELMESGLDEGVGENHPVHAAITYLQTHSAEADRMNYAR